MQSSSCAFDEGFEWLDTVGFDIPRLMGENWHSIPTFFKNLVTPCVRQTQLMVKNTFDTLETKLFLGVEAEAMKATVRRRSQGTVPSAIRKFQRRCCRSMHSR